MRIIFITLIFTLTFLQSCYCVSQILLTGDGWTLVDGNNTVSLTTTIPTDVYMSLYNAKLIPDPYVSNNDVKFRNISWQNWTFTKQFSIPTEFQQHKAIIFKASGIDTVSIVSVNGKTVGTTNNMFRRFVFDVGTAVNYSQPLNNLSIAFQSPLSYVLNQAKDYEAKYGYNVPYDCPPAIEHGECHPNFIRKMQSSFAWDWGPAFPTMGIYDNDLSLLGFDTCTILQFSIVLTVNTDKQFWILNVDFYIYCAQNLTNVAFGLMIDEISFQYSWTRPVQLGYNTIQNSTQIPINLVQRWWPNGFGTQKLYFVKGYFNASNESDSRTLNLGFRTVELIQEPVLNFTNGLTFYFKINDVPIFLKGSNWIPADSFLERVTQNKLEFYFASMKEANFNALRVWGGGVYETEQFYDLADQSGIMIFQDMMFASNLYPTNAEFLDNVEKEITDQVNRLKHRPSIIVWSGNNEVEAGIAGNWFKMNTSIPNYKSDYLKLYNDTIYTIVNATDYFSRPFLMSSPSNGLNTTRSGGLDPNPSSTLYGDVHIYKYWANGWNPKTYPVPRCCTEFGFQSLPSVETLLSALSEQDLAFFNPAILHRQHHPLGQLELLEEVLIHFDLFAPQAKRKIKNHSKTKTVSANKLAHTWKQSVNNEGKYFEELIYLTQIHQAMAYKTETEHYRRWRSTVNETSGEGLTMCALYWQLNDIWQAPTWSSIDYGMKWKMVHYYAKNFFAPILVSPFIDGENLKVSVISDSTEPLTNVKLEIDVHSWDSFDPKFSFKIPLKTVEPATATIVFEDSLPNILGPSNPENVDLFFNTRLLVGYQYLSPNNVIFPQSFKLVPKDKLGKVNVTNVQTTETPQIFLITLTTTSPAPFVWLDVKNVRGWFTDNGFTMISQNLQISFKAWDSNVTLADVTRNLTVTSLGAIYKRQNFK